MNIIEVNDLVKKFGDFEAVKHASFSVAQGEIFAFLGPNGAGKTTSIRILTTMLKRTGGEVLVVRHKIIQIKKSLLSKRFFIVQTNL